MKKWLKNFYRRLPIIRELSDIHLQMAVVATAQTNTFRQILLSQPKYQDSRRLNSFEVQTFSQNLEDGIIAEIFRRIGMQSKIFIELGVGDGIENNTVFWLMQGWRGFWVEGHSGSIQRIGRTFSEPIAKGRLKIKRALITTENVESILQELEVPGEVDLLSVDIDRNTYHVWGALHAMKPRVVVVEYNATFPPSADWVIDYQPQMGWNRTMYFGASLKAYERLGRSLGYELVGCDLSGTNAFFVRRDENLALFASPFTAEHHYEPPRYWMSRREAHARFFTDASSANASALPLTHSDP
jgi:hypothetical protein